MAAAFRNLSAVLLEGGASYDDIVPLEAVVQQSTTVDGGASHRVHIRRDTDLVTRIVCTRGDADAIALRIGGGVAHIGLDMPFEAPIPLVALQFHAVCLESAAGPFAVCVTYSMVPRFAFGALASAIGECGIVAWKYANGNALRAWRGLGGMGQALGHGVASPRALRA